MIKGKFTLNHPNGTGGCTVLCDVNPDDPGVSTRIYWTEGRSSDFVVVNPEGLYQRFNNAYPHDWEIEEYGELLAMSDLDVELYDQVMTLSRHLPYGGSNYI